MPSAIDTTRKVDAKSENNALPTPFDTSEPPYGRDEAEDIERPPVSPITPTLAKLDPPDFSAQDHPYAPPEETKFIERPPSLPINEDENFDVIALKSAISTLELQKLKARRDMLKLRQIRDAAVDEPENFVEDVKSGRVARETRPSDALKATLEGNSDDDDDDDDDETAKATQRSAVNIIPIPQDVVRCPPINWEKYHIIGEPLDRMHEEQRKRPDPGQPWSEAREAVVAAPFDPFKDKPAPQPSPYSHLPPPMQTRRSVNKGKSGG